MTLSSQITAETMRGNGSTRSFPFTFRAWTGEIKVIVTDPAGNEADVTALSVVTVYAYEDEGSQAGGSVTYPAASLSPPLPEGWKITIMRDMNLLQDERLVNASRFDPVVVEMALDRLTATDQQLAEKAARTVTIPVGSGQTPQELLGSIYAARDSAAASASNAAARATAAAGSAAEAGAAQAGAETSAVEAAGSAAQSGEAAGESEYWARKAEEIVASGIPDATEINRGGGFLATQAESESGATSPDRPSGAAVLMTPERTAQAIVALTPQEHRIDTVAPLEGGGGLNNNLILSVSAATPAQQDVAGSAGVVALAAVNDSISRDLACTPAGVHYIATHLSTLGNSGQERLINASGNWTAPYNGVYTVLLLGGGGGGGDGYRTSRSAREKVIYTSHYGGIGGAGGVTVISVSLNANQVVSLTVGGGGAPATAGGTTAITIGSTRYTAGGGSAGTPQAAGAPGAGAAANPWSGSYAYGGAAGYGTGKGAAGGNGRIRISW